MPVIYVIVIQAIQDALYSLNILYIGHNHKKYFEAIPPTYFPANAWVLPEYLSLPLSVIIVGPPQLKDSILKGTIFINPEDFN